MRSELLEESIRMELEQQAEKFGVNYAELEPRVQSWLRRGFAAAFAGLGIELAMSDR